MAGLGEELLDMAEERNKFLDVKWRPPILQCNICGKKMIMFGLVVSQSFINGHARKHKKSSRKIITKKSWVQGVGYEEAPPFVWVEGED